MTYVIATVALAAAAAAADVPLSQRVVSVTSLTLDRVIVGRASCGASTWLLTDAPALVEVTADGILRLSVPVRGFGRNERPWGLACVAGGELWTLADYRTLARISASGAVILRTTLRRPWLNVFGAGGVLLFQQPPTAAGGALLAAARPVDANRTEPWPGPAALPDAVKNTDLPSALVACGLGRQMRLPCWITTQTAITISDGAPERTSIVQPQLPSDGSHDATTPVWDVAVSSSVLWILTSTVSGNAGRRVAAGMTRTTLRGERLGSIELQPRARLILSATDRAATVLTSAGTVVEVAVR